MKYIYTLTLYANALLNLTLQELLMKLESFLLRQTDGNQLSSLEICEKFWEFLMICLFDRLIIKIIYIIKDTFSEFWIIK